MDCRSLRLIPEFAWKPRLHPPGFSRQAKDGASARPPGLLRGIGVDSGHVRTVVAGQPSASPGWRSRRMNAGTEYRGGPAVIVGADLNALGLARSLAVGNMPLFIVGDRAGGPAMDSRHGRKVPVAETAGEPLLAALERHRCAIVGPARAVPHRGRIGPNRVRAPRTGHSRFPHPAARAWSSSWR